MSTSEHFRNRVLSGGVELPVSPRRNRLPYPKMKPTAQASWGIDAIADGFNTSVAQHTALFTRVSGNLWLQQGLDQQGHAYMLELDWIPTIAELSVSYQFDPGTGFELVSQFSDLDYLGTSNYFSGARAWAGLHSAAVNFIGICTTGPWQFKY